MANILQSTSQYENWLRRQLGREVVEKDLQRKHDKMKESPFAFMRATYWRWAEIIFDVCPEAAHAPQVLAVGDIHLENFGTWRDVEGRLLWGVNDFDEAARMPFLLDIIRLATSGVVASPGRGLSAQDICGAILRGYRQGLGKPAPVVLDRERQWLRQLVVVSEKERAEFWKKIEAASAEPAPPRYRKALAASMPERPTAMKTARRTAGVGSLGRPRWIGAAEWRGAPVVREAKAVLTSSWHRASGRGDGKIRCGEIADGRYRAPDPWYRITDGLIIRRLSPNNRKIEVGDKAVAAMSPRMLETMGLELANVHLGTSNDRDAIERDLKRQKRGWLVASAKKMANTIKREFNEWQAA